MACRNCGYNPPEGSTVCPSCGQPLEVSAVAVASPTATPGAPDATTKTYHVKVKWAVPVGCVTALVLFLLFVGGIFALVFSLFRSSEPYRQGLARARENPRVQQVLGTPIEPGWFVTGSFNESGASGSADLAIPLSGPKGKGKLYVSAKKETGKWTFQSLSVEAEDGARIDLLEDARGPTSF